MRRILGCFIFFIIMTSQIFAGTVYYVDATNGDDLNDGLSECSAWKTIAKVNAQSFSAGDFILFKRGEIWRETLIVPSSGSSGNLITFGAYGSGNNPIINGADLITGWTPYNADQWQAACNTAPNVVWFDDVLGTKETAIANLNAEYEWYWTGNVLYVYSTTNPDAAYTSPGIEAGARNYCVNNVGKSYVRSEYITVRHSNHTGMRTAAGATYCEFDNLIIEYNQWRNGFVLTGNGTDYHTVTNCIARYNGDPGNEAGSGFTIIAEASNNTFEDCESHHNSEDGFGVGGNEAWGESNVGGTNNVFRRCNSHDNEEDGFDIKQGPNTIE